eukprot:TRINITY_DN2852_c0_g1_i1.p1 TRINITY_DN2852_c0_g1~~TRINITY_DN2852_c0_g1_i1.p1  ORF type:complete len:109 (-),score=13.68 TRINITY_DN2852_c0_g1_i1:391-717(-)
MAPIRSRSCTTRKANDGMSDMEGEEARASEGGKGRVKEGAREGGRERGRKGTPRKQRGIAITGPSKRALIRDRDLYDLFISSLSPSFHVALMFAFSDFSDFSPSRCCH